MLKSAHDCNEDIRKIFFMRGRKIKMLWFLKPSLWISVSKISLKLTFKAFVNKYFAEPQVWVSASMSNMFVSNVDIRKCSTMKSENKKSKSDYFFLQKNRSNYSIFMRPTINNNIFNNVEKTFF